MTQLKDGVVSFNVVYNVMKIDALVYQLKNVLILIGTMLRSKIFAI